MATLTWPHITRWVRSTTLAHEESLRRVAARLATQTVVLLLVLLVVLEAVVYLITQRALIGSLETTLKARANQVDPTVCVLLRLHCGLPGQLGLMPATRQPSSAGGRPFSPPSTLEPLALRQANLVPSDASAVYVNLQLHVFHADGILGTTLLDPLSIRQVLRSHQAQCCGIHSYKGQDYLVYTQPLRVNGKVVAAVQTSISEQQYAATLHSLQHALVIVALLGLVGSGGVSVVLVQRALRPIRRAMQRQRDFVADAAHELRTPLAIMRTVGEVGLNDVTAEERQATIEQMLAETRHLTRLVDDLSLLARADTNAVSIDHSPVDLSTVVQETTAEIGPLADEQGVSLTIDAEADIWVLGDMLRLRQLLLILLDNALKHTPPGGRIELRLRRHGGQIRLQVSDSGPGIDPADLPRIFDRFYRADKARTGEGSGLGLAIARWIVEAHGGHIEAGNAPGQGAVFTVTLSPARSLPAA